MSSSSSIRAAVACRILRLPGSPIARLVEPGSADVSICREPRWNGENAAHEGELDFTIRDLTDLSPFRSLPKQRRTIVAAAFPAGDEALAVQTPDVPQKAA